MKLFFVLAFLMLFPFSCALQKQLDTFDAIVKKGKAYEKTYEFFVKSIQKHEGFSDTVYLCAGGYKTIGYGHRVKKGEYFDKISKNEALALLENDFLAAIKLVEKDSLPERLELPIAHFVYCLGSGNYQKSTMRKHLLNAEYDLAKEELLKWCYIGNKKNTYLLKIRELEASFF